MSCLRYVALILFAIAVGCTSKPETHSAAPSNSSKLEPDASAPLTDDEPRQTSSVAAQAVTLSATDVLAVNFQDPKTAPPAGYLKDYGQPFGPRAGANQGGLTYGWVIPGTHTPVDLSVMGTTPGNGRNRKTPNDVRLATLIHMQAADLPDWFNGTRRYGAWEIAIANGRYEVTVSVGDSQFFNSTHGIRIEGVSAINGFVGSLTHPFEQGKATVEVADGTLTVEPTGTNTKLGYLEIRVAAPACGNHWLEAGEQCDDGNLSDGDGCSAKCAREVSSLPGLDVRPEAPKLALPSNPEIVPTAWTTGNAFPTLHYEGPVLLMEAPGTGHIFVFEREGKVSAIDLSAKSPTKKMVLDLSRVTQGRQDCGLLGLAFHPEFAKRDSPNKGYIYIHYAHTNSVVPPPVPITTPTEDRLSRFTVNLDTLAADPASELVLIAQHDEHVFHQGGSMFFHPKDGFLYLTVGDEGGANCAYDNCQRIDKDLFSGVLRIDVDMRGGNISHPIVRQPQSGSTAHYYIPNDNPFVGRPGVLEEFYAIGLRSPHRMTYDPVDDLAWISDVGQSAREEIDILERGANYQWNVLEGSVSHGTVPQAPIGTWTGPLLELGRDEANAIIGGFVYRGDKFPELKGKYLFGDYVFGTIWALTYDYDGKNVHVLKREQLLTGLFGRRNTITGFGTDSAGNIYLVTFADPPANIRFLQRKQATATLPAHLSDVGAFTDTRALTPAAGLIPYGVQNPLWSDGAYKRRWAVVPSTAKVGFATNGAWKYPEGTVFVKHFELALDERHPEQRRRIETRFLVAAPAGDYYGVTYRWNADQTDAEPLLEAQTETINVTQADGSVRQQKYFYPGPSDCLVCHNSHAGRVLGARTAQLNGPFLYEKTGRYSNQLQTWSALGILDKTLDHQTIASCPSLANVADETRSIEDRVRSYWDANCSMCHGVDPDIRATWDARYQTPLTQQKVVYGTLNGEVTFPSGSYVVVPGSLERSVLWQRDRSIDLDVRMPPLGRNRTDSQYIQLLERWILSLEGFEPPPTCSDGAKNGTETGIDCGGSCPACCTSTTYEAENMTHAVGAALDGGWNIFANGYIEADHTFNGAAGRIIVTARGTFAGFGWPEMEVSIGGVKLGSVSVASATYTTYSFAFPATTGTRAVRISFTNDYNSATEDRNLHVDKMQIACAASTGN